MIAMTACDLSACAKPWKTQYETVKVIFKEFYAQGDEEKARGRTPLPMMDRNTAGQLPSHQSGFLKGIVIPAYVILDKLVQGNVVFGTIQKLPFSTRGDLLFRSKFIV